MKINGNSITIQRGEAFTIDFALTNKDGSPFVVSSEFSNPYIRISIASNSFSTSNQYTYNQWCDLTNFYKFISTVRCDLSDAQNPLIVAPVNDWSNATLPAALHEVGVITVNGSNVYYCKDCVFSVTDTSGETTYRLFVFNEDPSLNDDYSGSFVEYRFDIIVSYSTDITSSWSSQNYVYEIALIETNEPVADGMADEDITILMSIPILTNGQIAVMNNVGGVN